MDQISSAINQFEQTHNDFTDPVTTLQWVTSQFDCDKIVMGTGLGAPGVALLDMLKKVNPNITVFYIDTGLLFKETYDLKNRLENHYKMQFNRVSTDISLEQQKEVYGDELWRRDPNLCCNIRKVLPLKKVLENAEVWITGIRRFQTKHRKNSQVIEYDDRFGVTKVNPLIYWTHDQVWDYIKTHDLPFNELHKQGYPSLGCFHCTSPVNDGEDDRSGRWKGSGKTECGLHFTQENGKFKVVKTGDN